MIEEMKNLIEKSSKLPKLGYEFLLDGYEANKYIKNNSISWNELSFQEDVLEEIRHKLQINKLEPQVLTQLDHRLVNDIQKKTRELNQNNITRTNAYLNFYEQYPEIHWAFLAHLVSRNGGWNMSDLKGSILTDLLTNEERNNFFSFLERANALIFHDAYPQLLLYEASKKRSKNLFYLLPQLKVSRFMRPYWDYFYDANDQQILTVALIINEQNYIEKRVIQHPSYKESIFENILFNLQEVFQFTYVLFPFKVSKQKYRLTGTTISDFANVGHRIEVGKNLYSLLFGNEKLLSDIKNFALKVPHTASRSDYWPEMFTKNKHQKLNKTSFSCRPEKPIVYSPKLEAVWEDVYHTFTDNHDWFNKNLDFIPFFSKIPIPASFDLTMQYCRSVHKMIIASDTMKMLNN